MKINSIIIVLACLVSCSNKCEYADYVNPFIGTSTQGEDAGKTFPGATTPWGMVQVNPNTITGGDNGPGYSSEHKTIEGFAFTQMSGIGWYGDFGNFLVMPTCGDSLYTFAGSFDGSIRGWRSNFDKSSEIAKAGYYSVHLSDYDILVEATAAQHSGALRFTFPESGTSRVQIDLARRVAGSSDFQSINVVDNRTIEGWMKCTPKCGGWGNGVGKADYTVYFCAEFDTPFTSYGFWSADISPNQRRKNNDIVKPELQKIFSSARIIRNATKLDGTHIGFYSEFPKKSAGEKITMKVGISFVDVDGARNNLRKEISDKSFDEIYSDARELWNEAFDKVKVYGGTPVQDTIFYTSLYHCMIDPRLFSDVDGRYVGGDGKVHNPGIPFQKRTIFSGWDVFRSQMPLLNIIYPDITNDMINSLVELADESGKGYLERWEFVNAYSGCMVGNPALSVIADAYAKGIGNFDVEKAFRECETTSQIGIDSNLMFYPGSISVTLECAYHDWCLSKFASMLGKDERAEFYNKKAQSYRNIFDTEVGWFRPRNADSTWGAWPKDGDRTHFGYGCVESNPYQQGWFVPHDINGMVELMGGREKALADLEEFFNKTPENFVWNKYYNHSNEPVHFVPFLFNHIGAPWLTQKWTRMICNNAYFNAIRGICGNDDCGQMSAWYVLSAAGIHPICPGDNLFEITSPLFDKVEFILDSKYSTGNRFTVIAHDQSPENIYIQKAEINGRPLSKPQISWDEISKGATLEIYLGPEPSPSAFSE